MAFDTALNLIWLCLGVFALCGTFRACRTSTVSRGPAWFQVCGVALIIAALFPYVSATDDVLRIERMDLRSNPASPQACKSDSHHNDGDSGKAQDALIRLYEIMDASVSGTVKSFSFSFSFVALVVTPVLRVVSRDITFRCGRSPPFTLALAHTA